MGLDGELPAEGKRIVRGTPVVEAFRRQPSSVVTVAPRMEARSRALGAAVGDWSMGRDLE